MAESRSTETKKPKQIVKLLKYEVNWRCEVCENDEIEDLNLVEFSDGSHALVCDVCVANLAKILQINVEKKTTKDKEFLECARCNLRFRCYTNRKEELEEEEDEDDDYL